jgi:hypothetical protein
MCKFKATPIFLSLTFMLAASSLTAEDAPMPIPNEPTLSPSSLSFEVDLGDGQMHRQANNQSKNGFSWGALVNYQPFSHFGLSLGWLKSPSASVTVAGQPGTSKSWSGYTAARFSTLLPRSNSDSIYIEAGASYNDIKVKSLNFKTHSVTPIYSVGFEDQPEDSALYWGIRYSYIPRSSKKNSEFQAQNSSNIMFNLGTTMTYLG